MFLGSCPFSQPASRCALWWNIQFQRNIVIHSVWPNRITDVESECSFRWRAATVNYVTTKDVSKSAKFPYELVAWRCIELWFQCPSTNLIICELSRRSKRIAFRSSFIQFHVIVSLCVEHTGESERMYQQISDTYTQPFVCIAFSKYKYFKARYRRKFFIVSVS